ncbi:MAG: carbohydrate ABC transporter permease, partial [Chloroflexi bacterium]|nr:carbohydrate ABC transporter permease [Chloroflexota bacterium]
MKSSKRQQRMNNILVNLVLSFMCLLWTIPTVGLLVSSFRDRFDIGQTGWWSIFPHRAWVQTEEFRDDSIPRDFDNDVPFAIPAIGDDAYLFDEWRDGVELEDQRVQWIGNKRIGWVEIQERQWTTNANFTLQNYQNVLTGKQYEITQPDGSVKIEQGDDMTGS